MLSTLPVQLLAACTHLPDWLNHIKVLGLSFSIADFLSSYGYLVVFLFIGVENLGIPFPGETMLLAASVYAAQGCGLNEPLVILFCILGSIVGSSIGFWVGRTGGRGLLRALHVNPKHLDAAEGYFVRYGSATVFFGRFLAVLRAWAAFLAGMNRMNALRFTIYNGAGAIIWSTIFGLLGFLLGKNLNRLQQVVTALGSIGIAIVVVIVVAAIVFWWLRRRRASSHLTEEVVATQGVPEDVASSAPDDPISAQAAQEIVSTHATSTHAVQDVDSLSTIEPEEPARP